MPDFSETRDLPDDFSGVVRLFPLPNLVLFPHVMQPLHIFEPRYRELLEDALSGDKLMAMALLSPGWEAKYEGRPPIETVVCVGRVVSHARLEDGRYNILLLGLARARVTCELPAERSFRRANVELFEDDLSATGAAERPALLQRLLELFRRLVPETAPVQEQLEQLLSHPLPLGVLTDIAAFTLALPISLKQELLSECNVDRRASCLIESLHALAAVGPAIEKPGPNRKFPPEFSEN